MKIHRYYIIIIIVVLLVNLNISHAQTGKEKRAGIKEYGLEFLGASVGECVIGVPALIVTGIAVSNAYGSDDDWWASFIMACIGGYVVGSAVGAPTGTILTGRLLHQKGSALGAFAGGFVGLTASCIILYNSAYKQRGGYEPYYISFFLPPLVSVIGYNLFPSQKSPSTSILEKYAPQYAVTCNPIKHENRTIPEISMKFIVNF